METKGQAYDKITLLKDGEHCYFNMFQDGGAVCYKCNGMYLLFEIALYGVNEFYEATYSKDQIGALVDRAFRWT